MKLNVVWPFLITVGGAIAGTVIRDLLLQITRHYYGRLKIDREAYAVTPTLVQSDGLLYHYVVANIRNNSKKTFDKCKAIMVLKGRPGSCYEVEAGCELCQLE